MHEARVRVIYGDTDQMGVVYYANYFRFFEAARAEFLRAHGGDYRLMEQEGYLLPVVEASCAYRAPARYDDLLRIPTQISEAKRVSLTFTYSVLRESDGELLSTGKTVHACVGRDGRPRRLPDLVYSWVAAKSG
jgi:acyl-CoA thioester hydrolase